MKADFKGRGAKSNTASQFLKRDYSSEHPEAIDEAFLGNDATEFIPDFPKKIINEVKSPDIPLPYSMNPYQGCEHGCIYCYARNTHAYWGLSPGLDFERKILVKENAPDLLREAFEKKSWKSSAIMFSGNTDCYQPIEREKRLTRKMLEVLLEYRNPVGMITKNSLILRDLDLLQEMAKLGLVHVVISLTTLDESLRRVLEPRTATGLKRVETISKLSEAGIPVSVLTAPLIPSLNSHEIPELLKAASDAGALGAGFTLVRLNGAIAELFTEWLGVHFPDRKEKVLSQIREIHDGSLEENRFGKRMRGEGPIAESIGTLFRIYKEKYFGGRKMPEFDFDAFRRPTKPQAQLRLF